RALHGRHDFLACFDRLPPRRVGRRRHRRRLAERLDVAARLVVQLRERKGAQGVAIGETPALLLGLGRDAFQQQDRLFPLHAGDQPALRPARIARDARGGRPAKRLRPPCAPRGEHAARGARLGPGGPVRGARGGLMKFAKWSTLALLALTAAPAFAWESTKPVEIVVAAGAGGASDQMARMMQAAIQKNNLMKQPMVVSLKGGASGAEALIYMKS